MMRLWWLLLLSLGSAGCVGWPSLPELPELPTLPTVSGESSPPQAPQLAVDVYLGGTPIAVTPSPVRPTAEGEDALPEAAAGPSAAGAPPDVRFEVFVADSLERVSDSRWVASGVAGREPIPVLPGFVTVVVELSPRERVGPFELEPGASATVRLLDFPGARPHTRTWRVERAGEPVGRAFPPPEKLGWVEEIRP